MTYILTELALVNRQQEDYQVTTRQVYSLETALYYILDKFEETMSRPPSTKDAYQPYLDYIQSVKPKLYKDELDIEDLTRDNIQVNIFPLADNVDAHLLVSDIEIEAHFRDNFSVFVKDLDYIDPL